jgi:hypothetical protein
MPRGGYRVGAGRPKGAKNGRAKPANSPSALEWLLSVVADESADPLRRDRCAIAALSFQRREKPGKREAAEIEAATAIDGTSWNDLLP